MLLQIGPVKGVAVGRRRWRLIALPNHLHRQCPDYALQLKRRKIQTREEQYEVRAHRKWVGVLGTKGLDRVPASTMSDSSVAATRSSSRL